MCPDSLGAPKGLLLICYFALGCSDPSAPASELRPGFTTWNVGLASGFVDFAAQRRPSIIQALRGLDSDVVCLQEVWTPEDVSAIRDATSDLFPHVHQVQLEDTSVGPAACGENESDPLVACVDSRCAAVAASEIAGCVLEYCRPEFDALSDDCTTCVVANIGKEVDEIVALCKTGSARYAYRGANGLMLLSRLPLSNTAHEKLESTNTQRSLLAATVSLPLLGDIAVVCTHLAADLASAGLSYTGPYESWGGENRAQADVVIEFTRTYASAAAHTVILGDFNSGPEGPPPLEPELPEAAFLRFSEEGFSAFPSSLGASAQRCTYCAYNLLVGDDAPSVLIDHIFIDVLPNGFVPSVTLVGTEPLEVMAEGLAIPAHPSDHFGVRLNLQRAP
jgi:endonuclease/exonuclease/phosphatase family metal-dependent hydrolase